MSTVLNQSPAPSTAPLQRGGPGGFLNNRRGRTLSIIVLCLLFFATVIIGSNLMGNNGLSTDFNTRHTAPSLAHPFGTDWLGRDMFARTVRGLSLSLFVGLSAAAISAVLGVILGTLSATFGGVVDLAITWLIDVFMSLPHLVLLILIAFVVGGGVQGVIISVAVTHWPNLARIMRAEVLQLKNTDYVQLSARLGRSPWWIARNHMLPHLFPQFLVGLILLFPHAILHEAAITFIGVGLNPTTPAIGIILSESTRYLSAGYWWLGVLPGLTLLVAVKAFDVLGQNVRSLLDPRTSNE